MEKPTIVNTPSVFQNLTFRMLALYYSTNGSAFHHDTFKTDLALLTEEGKYNILAQLLADDSHFSLHVSLYAGKSKEDRLIKARDFGGKCIAFVVDDLLRYLDVLNIRQADERNRIVARKEVLLFNQDAIREAIVNAFVHNLWVSGNEPTISVFSDRIEILSRGAIDPNQTMEGFFLGQSVPVNEKLSEIFLQLHISEKTGRGVPVITSKYGKEAFTFYENAIVVTIPFNWLDTSDEERKAQDEGRGSGKKSRKPFFLWRRLIKPRWGT